MKPAIHGRDHRRGGADPIPFDVFLAPSGLMGRVMFEARLADISFGLSSGVLYVPSNEGPPVETGDTIRSSYAFADPDPSFFDWIGSRAHIVTGLSTSVYRPVEPWESDPWFGRGSSSTTGASATITHLGSNWNGFFYAFCAVSEDDSDVVHFQTPGLAVDDDEQYGWDVPGVGHIGYMFHDFNTSETGDLTVSFASGAGPRKVFGYIRMSRTGAVTVGAMAGETTGTGTSQSVITLTDDVPEDAGLMVIGATQAPSGYDPSLATSRPVVDIESRAQDNNLVPVYRIGSQLFPIMRDIGGLGQAGGDIDGGSP